MHGERTRAQLIEVAGRVFAERGFDGATGQQICRRAGVHSAAIVYHFGGMAGLYRCVLEEALRRLVTTEQLSQAVAGESDPRKKLAAFLGLIVRALTSPVSRSWAGRLFGREFVSPTAAHGQAHDRALAERARMLRAIVATLLGCVPDSPLVARTCISIMAPCALLLLVNRRKLQRLMPALELDSEAAAALTRHLVEFALAGMAAVANSASAPA